MIYARDAQAKQYAKQGWDLVKITGITVDVYLPRRLMEFCPVGYFESLLEQAVQGSFRALGVEGSRYEDLWRLETIEEAPPCEACSWCSEDMTVSTGWG